MMKKINKSTFYTSLIVIIFIGIFFGLSYNTNFIYSQDTSDGDFTTNVNSVSSRLFEDFFPLVTVEYESNTLVVLRGDEDSLLMLNGILAPLWNAVDIVKTEKGFKLKEIITSGIGNKENPTRIYVIMEK